MKKIIKISLFSILLIGLCVLAYFLFNKVVKIKNEVNIKEIEIDTGVTFSKNMQDMPTNLIEAKGNYILYTYETGKFVYNGKDIDKNSGEVGDIGLSHNGLHYTYILKKDNKNTLYIDGNSIITSDEEINMPAVADNGKDYFYVIHGNMAYDPGDRLFKNNEEIFKNEAEIDNVWINSDGSTYFVELRNVDNNNNYSGNSLVKNGIEIYNGLWAPYKEFSDNGEHYAYTTDIGSQPDEYNEKLIVDGNEKYFGKTAILSQVTNSGNYVFCDSNENKCYINNKVLDSVNTSKLKVYINDDASNILTRSYDTEKLFLDGKDLGVKINFFDDIEIDGNTIYIYRIKNQDLTDGDIELNITDNNAKNSSDSKETLEDMYNKNKEELISRIDNILDPDQNIKNYRINIEKISGNFAILTFGGEYEGANYVIEKDGNIIKDLFGGYQDSFKCEDFDKQNIPKSFYNGNCEYLQQ